MSHARLVYSTDVPNPRTQPPARANTRTSHASRYVASLYTQETLDHMRSRIAWLKALTAERAHFETLPAHTQANVNAWWLKRIAQASRFEGGAHVARITDNLTALAYALEATLASRERACQP